MVNVHFTCAHTERKHASELPIIVIFNETVSIHRYRLFFIANISHLSCQLTSAWYATIKSGLLFANSRTFAKKAVSHVVAFLI